MSDGNRAMRALAAAALFMLGTIGTAWADTCPATGKPVVEVRLPDLKVISESSTNVASKAPWPRAMETSLGPGWTINGLTLVRPQVTTQIHTVETKTAGGTCIQATKAIVDFSFADPARVYVSSKYAVGSCEHTAILAHENQHVGIHLNTRAAYAPILRKRVQDMLTSAGTVQATTSEAATAELQARLSAVIDEGIREFQGMTARFNAMIDTTENYLALQAGCDDW